MTEKPPIPPDCDLQDFPFMPLHVARLRDSDLANEEHPEACWYAVLLWAASWHQLPAGSLPDNEAVLTKLVGLGRDVKTFRKRRAGAMRGFVLCSDGRWYHGTVVEQALEAWRGKLVQRWKTECARLKKRAQRDKVEPVLPSFEEFHATLPETSRLPHVLVMSPGTIEGQARDVPEPSPERPPISTIQETETGTETGTIEEREATASPAAPVGATASASPEKSSREKANVQPIWLTDPKFTSAWNGCTDQMRKRSESREKTWPIWRAAVAKAGGADALLAGLLAYVRTDEDVKRTGGPGFHLWLKDGRWEHWLGQDGGASSFGDLAAFDAERARITAELERMEQSS